MYDWNNWDELDDFAHFLLYCARRVGSTKYADWFSSTAANPFVFARCKVATLFISLCRTAYGTTTTVARVHRAHVDVVTEFLKKATECDITEEPQQG